MKQLSSTVVVEVSGAVYTVICNRLGTTIMSHEQSKENDLYILLKIVDNLYHWTSEVSHRTFKHVLEILEELDAK